MTAQKTIIAPSCKALVLLSGGQDSTTCLFWAKANFDEVHALTLCYGQRHVAEVKAAMDISALAGVASHRIVDVPVLGDSGSALTSHEKELTGAGGYHDEHAVGGLPSSFVPGRNMVFLALAGAHAQALGIKNIVTGVCQTDYSGYPDCRETFIEAMQDAINLGAPTELRGLRIHTPLMRDTKADTVRMMQTLALKFPHAWEALALSVTCYHGYRPGCGTCPSCALRVKGFAEASIIDPARA